MWQLIACGLFHCSFRSPHLNTWNFGLKFWINYSVHILQWVWDVKSQGEFYHAFIIDGSMVETEYWTVFKNHTWMVGIYKHMFFPHIVYIWNSVVMTAFLVILVGTFATVDSSFVIINQHKYGYSGWHNENLAILISDSESPDNLKPGGM